jgi:Helix-turn-helix domain
MTTTTAAARTPLPMARDLPGEYRWLSSAEACKVLGVTRGTLTNYAKAGRLHPKRLGGGEGSLRWHLPELLALLEDADVGNGAGALRGRVPRAAFTSETAAAASQARPPEKRRGRWSRPPEGGASGTDA